jgi:formiminotetrahydrofolate cyclodeaminase
MEVFMLMNMPLESFGRAVASDAPVPGGGSVSALAGALAAALAAMVADLTLKKEKFAAVHPEMADLQAEAGRLQEGLMQAVDEDAESYRGVLAAFRMPKSDDAQKQARRKAVQSAFRRAAEVPLKVAEYSARVMDLAGTAAARGNPDMVTDAGVGIVMARAAALGALMNVQINLKSIEDPGLVEEMRQKTGAMKAAVLQKEAQLLKQMDF